MENIKYYLEAMFANLPNTEAVRRARDELMQMMEDKYSELISEGRTENEAVGTVIMEFGNLDELAESLGISTEVQDEKADSFDSGLHRIGMEEAQRFLGSETRSAFINGLALLLLINCVNGPIISSALGLPAAAGISAMFIMIAAAILMFINTGSEASKWKYISKRECVMDVKTAEFIYTQKESRRGNIAMNRSIGITFIAFCWLPAAIIDAAEGIELVVHLGGVFLFLFAGIGIALLSFTGRIKGSYDKLLNINNVRTVAGTYTPITVRYRSRCAEFVMRVYWVTAACLYVMLSFITFRWDLTWILWPVAVIAYVILSAALKKEVRNER